MFYIFKLRYVNRTQTKKIVTIINYSVFQNPTQNMSTWYTVIEREDKFLYIYYIVNNLSCSNMYGFIKISTFCGFCTNNIQIHNSNKIMSFTSFFKVNINFKNKIFYTKSEYGCHIRFVVENTMMVTSK